ncbi:SH3 domain-containing protein [Leptospira borgpetersenii]|uniref:SH3 domain-containing protein n=1 Tax=Leptospira borgpetersenii TaxID=174 RepID=UPI00191035B3|nr:SH3 domain-containing protein [Leptospira borgpetersenii]
MRLIVLLIVLFMIACSTRNAIVSYAIVRGDAVNVRSDSNLASKRIRIVKKGELLTLIKRSDHKDSIEGFSNYWYKYKNEAGEEGWVYGSFLTLYQNIHPNAGLFINKFKSTVSNLFPLVKKSSNKYTRYGGNYNDYEITISVEDGILILNELEKYDLREQKVTSVYILKDDRLFQIYRGLYPSFNHIESNCFITINSSGVQTYDMDKILNENFTSLPGAPFEQISELKTENYFFEYETSTGYILQKSKINKLIEKKYKLTNCKLSNLAQ